MFCFQVCILRSYFAFSFGFQLSIIAFTFTVFFALKRSVTLFQVLFVIILNLIL